MHRQHPPAARTTRHIADRVQHLAQIHSRLPATPRRLRQQRLDLHPLLVRQVRRVALRLSAKIGHPAPGRSGPHPEFESLPAAPLLAILKRSLKGLHPRQILAMVFRITRYYWTPTNDKAVQKFAPCPPMPVNLPG